MINTRSNGKWWRSSVMTVAAVTLFSIRCVYADERTLPAGRTGIAAEHPGDRGIENDPRIVFVERFNAGSLDAVIQRWEQAQSRPIMSISADVPTGSADGQSLLMTHVGGKGNGGHLYRRLMPGYERLYYRFYVKFDPDCWPIHHFFHVGGYHPATPWPQGGAGERPRGNERFTTGVEPFGDAWRWDYYSYWMEMRGSPPRGQPWGNKFLGDRQLVVKRGEWQCLELMMHLNDVGESNGEMALWVDGRLTSHLGKGFPHGKWVFDKFLPGEGGAGIRWNDKRGEREQLDFPPGGAPFPGFRFRSDESLDLNFLWLLCYITQAPQDHVSRVWFDNVVVAQEYIGPIEPEG